MAKYLEIMLLLPLQIIFMLILLTPTLNLFELQDCLTSDPWKRGNEQIRNNSSFDIKMLKTIIGTIYYSKKLQKGISYVCMLESILRRGNRMCFMS